MFCLSNSFWIPVFATLTAAGQYQIAEACLSGCLHEQEADCEGATGQYQGQANTDDIIGTYLALVLKSLVTLLWG